MKKKGTLIIISFLTIILIGKKVNAKEIYYTNSKGVSFTKEQYDFYTYLTHDGYQEYVTQEMLDEIVNDNISTIQKKVIRLCPTDLKEPKRREDNTYVATSAKALSMGQYCSSISCRVFCELEWLGEPNVKSHDVMGSYLSGPTRVSVPSTTVSSSVHTGTHETVVYDTNGFGALIQVPNGDDIFIDQTYTYSGTGIIFYTYQHAMSGISYNNAQLFTIGLGGYGNVLDFYGAALGVYDDMPGVYMNV